jgi:GT2 family glycosyltransferase
VRTVSAIVTSYNRPGHLVNCLASLEAQTAPPDEVVIADDGSTPEHLAAIEEAASTSSLQVKVVTRPDDGYRVAASRNNGVRQSTGDVLFFTDGDVLLFPDVLERHLEASEGGRFWTTGYFVPLTEAETARIGGAAPAEGLEAHWLGEPDPRLARLATLDARFRSKLRLARLLPFEAHLRKLGLRTCNASVPRAAFEAVNGFDEAFVGWGCEDDDLGLRLLLSGSWGRSVFASARALHQFHPTESQTKSLKPGRVVSVNNPYHKRRRWRRYVCAQGLSQGSG